MVGLPAIAFAGLRRRGWRSALVASGVAVAAAAYLVLVTTGLGLRHEFGTAVTGSGGHLTVQRAGAALPVFSFLAPEELRALAAAGEVQRVEGAAIAASRDAAGGQFLLFGLEPGGMVVRGFRVVAGRELSGAPDELLVGSGIAPQLGVAPGDAVELMGRRLAVVGVYTSGRSLADHGAACPLPTVQAMFALGRSVNLAFVELGDPGSLTSTLERLRAAFPRLQIGPSDEWGFTIRQFEVAERFARWLGLVALAVAALGVGLTLTLSVTERWGELALLRALGWRRRRVGALVLLEAGTLCLVGSLAGAAAAALALRGVAAMRAAGSFGTTWVVPATIPLPVLGAGIGLTIVAGLIGSVPAILHALRLRPAEALRPGS